MTLLNHYLATHTFHSDKIKKEYYRSIKSRKNNDWFAEINNPDHPLHERAKVVQVFIGREDFFFCHWYAESEQVILEKLTSLGADEVIVTMASKIEAPKMNKSFITSFTSYVQYAVNIEQPTAQRNVQFFVHYNETQYSELILTLKNRL